MFRVVCVTVFVCFTAAEWNHDSVCEGNLLERPQGADIEIRIGELPVSTVDQPVYLSWWAAMKSNTPYNPLNNSHQAEVYNSSRRAYAKYGTTAFNGGMVRVSEAGEATLWVQAPAVYNGHGPHSDARDPHVHFMICGQRGKPKAIIFSPRGVFIKGGCKRGQRGEMVSYKMLSVRHPASNMSVSTFGVSGNEGRRAGRDNASIAFGRDATEWRLGRRDNGSNAFGSNATERRRGGRDNASNAFRRGGRDNGSNALGSNVSERRRGGRDNSANIFRTNSSERTGGERGNASRGKDWDALEFSNVYRCLEDAQFFDQFNSKCATQCPPFASLAQGQCVRKEKDSQTEVWLKASWYLQLDCSDKCWEDAMPMAHHSVRLALADHLDITFQEAKKVHLSRDREAPQTGARLTVFVKTRRLNASLGAELLDSFLVNSNVASDILDLVVQGVQQARIEDDDKTTNATFGSNLPGEDADQFAEYYAPLAQRAERQTQPQTHKAEVAGIPLPESVPVAVLIGGAVGIVVALSGLGVCLYRRRHAFQKSSPISVSKDVESSGEVDGKVVF